jgi:NADH-quinone oxidoreductase subunit G
MATVIIDGTEIQIGDQERLNGIQAAERAGIEIPHYCWHAGLSVVASCRMCLVQTGSRNPQTGQIQVLPKLVPACQTPAKDGTVFVTNSPEVKHARAFVEEGLLLDHPIDCPICDKAGECRLQDYHFQHGQPQRRADIRPFTSRKRVLGDTVTLFVERCVMCSRCVRFCREVAGTSELLVTHRGSHEEIDVFPGRPLANKLSGNVVDLCPVGALADRDFLYSQRVWFMQSHAGICTGCSAGCNVWVDENQDHMYRLRPRENPKVNQWWMCDDGRHGFHYVHSPKRLTAPRRREKAACRDLEWPQVWKELPPVLRKAGRLAAVLSPHLTVEEAYLLAKLVRSIDPEALLALGPVPVVGTDERFPSGFTIRAEKCPNHNGVYEVVRFFAGRSMTFEELREQLEPSGVMALWVTGGYPHDWIDQATAQQCAKVGELIVQDVLPSPLWEWATWQLPGASFAEKAGSYVNHSHRLQSVNWAIRPPAGARPEGSVYWRLLALPGMYNARSVLDEVAATIPYFAAARQPMPEVGVDLRVNQLAGS